MLVLPLKPSGDGEPLVSLVDQREVLSCGWIRLRWKTFCEKRAQGFVGGFRSSERAQRGLAARMTLDSRWIESNMQRQGQADWVP